MPTSHDLLALACRGLLLAACSGAPVLALAQADAPARPPEEPRPQQQLDRVEIKAQTSDEDRRRASTASKIVVGREEIERYGDSTVGEVLKRLPGVTIGGRPGRGGDIRMRGMGGGYTQILVNGERMPPGFSVDEIAPEQVERIEVMRAPTAEYGARAIAGTINIVLREALQRRLNELRFGLAEERGKLDPSFSWTRNDKLNDDGGTYNLTINAQQTHRLDDIDNRTRTRELASGDESVQQQLGSSESTRKSINLTSRLQWKLDGGDSFALQPFVVANESRGSSAFTQSQTPEVPAGSPGALNFDEARTTSDSRMAMGRLNAQWNTRLDESNRAELKGSVGALELRSDSLRQESLDGAPSRTQQDEIRNRDQSWSLSGKLTRSLEDEHSLVAGAETEGTQRRQTRHCLQNGLDCSYLADFGDDIDAGTRRVAVYAQDEWSLGKQWSFYAGLRWEGIETRSDAPDNQVTNRSGVFSPLLHAVYRFDEKGRDQVRMSLTRSYRSPNLQDLIARPSVNSQYPCPDGQSCGPNEINYPDRMGNPDLKPELATGIEIGYEKYLAKGGLLGANFFFRHIDDLMRTVTQLETVPWASVPRWVARPRNIGTARTMGLELEAKFRLDEWIDDALPVNLRSNVSLFHSQVDDIPGPHNTLDQQPRYTANLGADYRLRSLPLTLAGSINYTPVTVIQQSDQTTTRTSAKRVFDASAVWTFSPAVLLRLGASNLAPLDYDTGALYVTPDRVIRSDSLGRSFTVWSLRVELKV